MALQDYIPVSNLSRAAVVVSFLLLTFILVDTLQKRRLPPGPRILPLLGNYLDLPHSGSWHLFTSWSKLYGGIYTFYPGLSPRLVISDPQIAHDLLTGRSSKYSSRPELIVFGKFFSKGEFISSLPYGPSWLLRRKILHQFMKPQKLNAYKERQEAEASRLIYQLSRDDEMKWRDAVERYTSSVVFTLSYGRRIDSLESKAHKYRMDILAYSATLMAPGRYLVESLPFLQYLPPFLQRWKRAVEEKGNTNAAFDQSLVEDVRHDIEKNGGKSTGRESLTENMLLSAAAGDQDLQVLAQNERHFCGVPSTLFGAGSATTIATLCAAILGMVQFPHVFLAAQREIDAVVGKDRSPAFSDRVNLPYVEALVKEALRWRPVTPIGLSHATSEADTYKGYHIPKGTTVTYNVWGMHHDESYFPNPSTFAPERFLPDSDPRFNPKLKGKEFPNKHGHGGFGWGRRICAGADLANNGMWIALAKLVWGLELMPVEGEDYENVRFDGTIIVMVEKFAVRWKGRDGGFEDVIEKEMREAESVLEQFPVFE